MDDAEARQLPPPPSMGWSVDWGFSMKKTVASYYRYRRGRLGVRLLPLARNALKTADVIIGDSRHLNAVKKLHAKSKANPLAYTL